MSKQIIEADPNRVKDYVGLNPFRSLKISEFFSETIQAEGVSAGMPAAFLRVADCTLSCIFCDSKTVWRFGNFYSFEELWKLMEDANLPQQFVNGVRLVLTGGSPLKAELQLINFIKEFIERYGFKPYIEVENECTLMPSEEFITLVDQWNNSPKLNNSNMPQKVCYKPKILKRLSELGNSWFKFVFSEESDWYEIESNFIEPGLIRREQVIIMPEGENRSRLHWTRELAVNVAIREGVRYSDRLQIILWDNKKGV